MAAKKKTATNKAKAVSEPLLKEGQFSVEKVAELNAFDATGERAGTKGTSSKFYYAELHFEKNGPRAQIYSMYGPTGHVQRKEYRHYLDQSIAADEYEKLLNSKRKKNYRDVEVAQRTLGTSDAKKITKAVSLKNVDAAGITVIASNLHKETERLVTELMGATNQFVVKTLKCPLGQLTNNQIDKGRACLDEAKVIVAKKSRNKSDDKRILELTNEFYSLIPHNLGRGARGQMTELLLDTHQKVITKEYHLDTLLDAKAIGATLVSNSVQDQYDSLDTDFVYIEKKSELFNWLFKMVKTRGHGHGHIQNIKLLNAWEVSRHNEEDVFKKRANQIAEECGKQSIPPVMKDLVSIRPDKIDEDLFYKANILPLFHGTRTQNISGVIKKGLVIRPSGAVVTGSYFDKEGGLYFADVSCKSINYTSISGSYYAKGMDKKAFLFITNCALGKTHFAKEAYPFTKNGIKPCHSVWAVGGKSSVMNDEFILYDTDQHNIKYIMEFTYGNLMK